MGILNVTPDSFSDGGRYSDPARAIERALEMIDEGAGVIDVGGESTRPGATPVPVAQELGRVLPVVEGIRRASDVFISVDTSAPEVIRQACAAGADLINDVRGLRAEGAVAAVAQAGAAACLMHMQGDPGDMQNAPRYDDVLEEVTTFLAARTAECVAAGIARDALVLDPGFGFGKTLAHNLELLRRLSSFADGGYPVLMGASRKSMFAKLYKRDDITSRITGSLGAAFWAAQRGVSIIRAHDVRQTVQMVDLARLLHGDNRPTDIDYKGAT